jgi:ubiquinone/menaquinone biosynthesis C-methylase UbiE
MEGERMSKGPGVQKMFDAIAGSYDLMNRVMTLGQDQRWRRLVVQRAQDPGTGWALDLATGTEDIAALQDQLEGLTGARQADVILAADVSTGTGIRTIPSANLL